MPDADPTSESVPHPSKERASDRPSQEGLPPDHGPEVEVIRVRPSLWRAHPIGSVFLVILPVLILVGAIVLAAPTAMTSLIIGGVSAVIFWFLLFAWWMRFTVARSLWISNKRTIERRGLLSRSINEVMHDHVLNIQVKQTFLQRVFGIGSVGISSAGQEGIEIFMKDLPRPDDIKRTIDLYRPL
jgi:uncharacterized membrane protein YdbT with pleckstrin-like domain